MHRFALASVLVIALIGLSGCTREAPDDNQIPKDAVVNDAWRGLVDTYLPYESDYVKAIFEDGVITAQEAAESEAKLLACLSDAGLSVETTYDEYGFANYHYQSGDTVDAITLKCEEWSGMALQLYHEIRKNPENLPYNDLMAKCLISAGAVDTDFTGEDYEQYSVDAGITLTPGPDGVYVPIKPRDPSVTPTLPGGVSGEDPRVLDCERSGG
jgi:hypothetical protein